MKQTARSWRVVTVAGLAVGAAGVLGLAGPTASADPAYPPRPNPAARPDAPGRRSPVPGIAAAAPATGLGCAGPGGRRGTATCAAGDRAAAPPVARRRRSTPASSGTLRDFFASKGVKLEPQTAAGLQGPRHHPADAAGLDPGARPQRARCVRGDRRPGAATACTPRTRRSWSTSWSATSTRRRPSPTATSTASSCPPGAPPTPRWPTSAASPSSIIEGTYRQNDDDAQHVAPQRHRDRRDRTSTWCRCR